MAKRVGREGDMTFWGGSRILDAYGNLLAKAGSQAGLISARLDYADTRRARAMLPTVRDSNIALAHRETTRLIETLGVPTIVRDQ